MPLTDDTRQAAREIVARYPRPRSALLPMLHLVQSEDGYVSPEGVRFCADELGLTKAEVGAVATFYTMYKRRPAGEYLVSVCTNTLCDVLGGQEIYETLSESLGVGHDETTADGRITLEHAECLAACDYAPVVTVNYEFFDQQTVDSATGLVGELQAGRRPQPTRGAPLCSFKEISRQLAGFPDLRPGAVDAGQVGEPTLVGNRLAVRQGETAPAYDAPIPLDTPAEPAPAAATGAGAPPAAPAPTPAERTGGPAAAAQTPAERSAEAGTARYGGPPEEASSGGGEGGQGVQTSASDPASSVGSGVSHEPDTTKSASGSADAPTAAGPEIGTGRRPATGSAASGGTPGGPTRTASAGTGAAGTGAAGSGTGVASATEVDTSGTATGPGPAGDTGTAGSATGETQPGRPGPDGEVAATPPGPEAGSGGDASGEAGGPAATPTPDRARPTNRGRKTRKEG